MRANRPLPFSRFSKTVFIFCFNPIRRSLGGQAMRRKLVCFGIILNLLIWPVPGGTAQDSPRFRIRAGLNG
jgi:hypothetical protein